MLHDNVAPLLRYGTRGVCHGYLIEGFVKLVSVDIIEAGLDAGLLDIHPGFDQGAGQDLVCWSGGVDPSFPRFP